jgi:hypothetical protein
MQGKARVRQRAYNDLRSKTVVQVTDTDIDALKSGLFAQGGRNESEYAALEKIEHMSGQSSSSGYLLGTLTAVDKSISLDTDTNLVFFPDSPRANYKLEKVGIIGTSLSLGAGHKIRIIAEIGSAEVPLLSAEFGTKYSTSDSFAFDLNVTVPQGTSSIYANIVSDITYTPSLSIGLLYGRVR